MTRLGRAVRATLPAPPPEQHRKTNWLRDVILGGQDGLVNMLGIALGVISAGGSTHVLVVTGWAAAITESISMGAVAYTSYRAEQDYYRAEEQRELEEIEAVPEIERQEIRGIYAAKGFEGELLDQVVDTITSNRDVWLKTMMDEELQLQPVETPAILRSSVVVTTATVIGHAIPLLPFMFIGSTPALITALIISALALFGVGVYSAKTLVGDWRRSGLQMVVIGLGAAGVGFFIGRLFHSAGA